MKLTIKNQVIVPVVIAILGWMVLGGLRAQTFTTLHSFDGVGNILPLTNYDGAGPEGEMVLADETLYGLTFDGGFGGYGTVFKVKTDGTGLTTLHHFFDSDGAAPFGRLVLSGDTLFGTTFARDTLVDGVYQTFDGTVFKVGTNGDNFAILHTFSGADGSSPWTLTLGGDALYGTTERGGTSNFGTVFKINVDGTGFTNLHNFTFISDGGSPYGGLALSGDTLYGATFVGGVFSNGLVFSLNTNGAGFTILHNFDGTNEGGNPYGAMALADSTLYGIAGYGGSSGFGTVFAVHTDGTGFTNLHTFTTIPGSTNAEGAISGSKLWLSGNILYGTRWRGGAANLGTVFTLNTDGTGFMNLHSFTATSDTGPYTNYDGCLPTELILSGNRLFGTAEAGGFSGTGTLFNILLTPPVLTINRSDTNVVLTWPNYAPGVSLQSTTNLGTPTNWSAVVPAPVLVNGQNTVTNPVSGSVTFYRLVQ